MYPGPTPWQTGSSFKEPVPIPTGGPLGDPLVCFSLSRSWLPVILGALLQLAQPAAWAAADDAARTAVLLDVQDLLHAVGTAEDCPMLAFRFVACTLQVSYDDGGTWADVPGWDTFASGCFTGPTGATGATGETGAIGPAGGFTPGPPPNPQGTLPSQLGCNIAGYLAQSVLQASIAQAYASYNAGSNLVAFAAALAGVVLGLGALSGLLAGAAAVLYDSFTAGNKADFLAASTDGTLRSEMICALFSAIGPDGYITAGNFAAAETGLRAVAYAHAEVITAIGDYWHALGLTGVQQAQAVGALAVYDCTGCAAPWCYTFDFTASDGGWTLADATNYPSAQVASVGWQSTYKAGVGQTVYIQRLFAAAVITKIEVVYHLDVVGSPATREKVYYNYTSGAPVYGYLTNTAGDNDVTITSTVTTGAIAVAVQSYPSHAGPNIVSRVTLRGTGTNPFGASNCT